MQIYKIFLNLKIIIKESKAYYISFIIRRTNIPHLYKTSALKIFYIKIY